MVGNMKLQYETKERYEQDMSSAIAKEKQEDKDAAFQFFQSSL